MNSDVLIPKSVEELADHVKSQDRILAVGNQTKPPLSRFEECALVSLSALSGMIEYEPSEFTFTAWAGTKLSEIESELSLRGQYLPFDPLGNRNTIEGVKRMLWYVTESQFFQTTAKKVMHLTMAFESRLKPLLEDHA